MAGPNLRNCRSSHWVQGVSGKSHRWQTIRFDRMNLSFNPYVPILAIGAIGFGFAIFSVAAAALTGPKRYNRAKSDAYECGIQPSPQAAGGGRFPIKYFLTAMLFFVFFLHQF